MGDMLLTLWLPVVLMSRERTLQAIASQAC